MVPGLGRQAWGRRRRWRETPARGAIEGVVPPFARRPRPRRVAKRSTIWPIRTICWWRHCWRDVFPDSPSVPNLTQGSPIEARGSHADEAALAHYD